MDIVAPFLRVAPEEHVLVKERAQESGYALIQDFPDLEAALEALFALSVSYIPAVSIGNIVRRE